MAEENNRNPKEEASGGVSPIPWEDLTREEEEELRRETASGDPAPAKENGGGAEWKAQAKQGKVKKPRKPVASKESPILTKRIAHPIWLRVSEAAKLGGVGPKTVRRALKARKINFKVAGNRYFIELKSLILYLHTTKKLHNKLKRQGLGQYIEKWKK